MKLYRSFRQYLAERDFKFATMSEGKKALNEAVMGQAKQFWPNFSLADIIKVSFFSDDWTSESIFGKLTGKFPVKSVEKLESAMASFADGCGDQAYFEKHRFATKYKNKESIKFDGTSAKIPADREQLVVNYQGDDWKTVDELIKTGLKGNEKSFLYAEPVVKVPPPPTFTQMELNLHEAAKATSATFKVSPAEGCPEGTVDTVFGKIETALKPNKAAKVRRIKPTGEIDLTVSGTVFDLIQAFAVLEGSAEGFWKSTALSEQTADPVKALMSVTSYLSSAATDELMSKFKKQFDFSSDLGVTQKWLLNFAYGSIYKKHKKMTDADIDAVIKKAEAEGHPIPADQVEQMRLKQMTKDQIEALATKECWDGEKTKSVLAALPNPEFGSVDEFCDYFKKNHIEQQIGNFSEIWRQQRAVLNAEKVKFMEKVELSDEKWAKDPAEVEKRLDKLENDVKDAWTLKLELPQVKNLWQLQGIIDWHGSVDEIAEQAAKVKEIVQTKPNHATSGSERRMKLFYAAQHADPNTEIIQTADWVVAVCRSAKATAPFGRLKPKVIKGTNDVDPKCNLEDWEGITPDAKKWRDNPTTDAAAYIKDGVEDGYGHSFDTVPGEHSQTTVKNAHIFCETAWCFTGVLAGKWGWSEIKGSSDFNKYSESNTRPVLIMMDTKRGALYAYAHFRSGGQELENFLNENEKCDGDPKNGSDPSDARQKEFLEKFKASHQSFNALLAQLNRKYYPDFNIEIDDEVGYDDYKPGEVKNAVASAGAHPAAIRRLKLFKAAEHWGATVIRTPKWVIGVCDGHQMQPFGRYKPIASKDDPSKPDPKYNLEDWEGITPEAKKIRDRVDYEACKKYDCVKDGITDGYGISYDHLVGHSGQGNRVTYAESCWCVCGALNNENFPWGKHAFKYNGFDSYTQGSGGKAFVCMDMSRGAMYLWTVGSDGSDNIANERDSMDSFSATSANSGPKQATWFKNKFLPSHPELQILIDKLKKKYGGKISSSAHESMTPEQLAKKAADEGRISPNGALVLKSTSDAVTYRPIFGKFTRIVVDAGYCSGMFKCADLTNVQQIDFSGSATVMDETFRDAQIDVIDVIGTYNVTSFARCFMDSRLEQLTGLDTSSAQTITQMFYNVKTSKNGKLRLPPLNLKKCYCIDRAFSNTNIVNVKLENADEVTSAVDAYTYCPYLVNYPQTMFPKVSGLKKLTDGKTFVDMFAGCDQLMNVELAPVKKNDKGEIIKDDVGFDELLKRTEDYYSEKDASVRFDADGYYRVETEDSLECDYYKDNAQKIEKIRIHSNAGANFFNGVSVYAKTIDLNGIEDASLLFCGASFKRVPVLTGCEKIKNAEGMFRSCMFAIAPNLDLPSVTQFRDVFASCANLHQLPKMKVGKNFAGDYDVFMGVDYVFGDGDEHAGAEAKCGLPRLEKFCKTLLEQIVGEVKIPGAKTSDGGEEAFEPRTSEIEAEFGSVGAFFKKLAFTQQNAAGIKKITVDTEPDNMFAEVKSKGLALKIEFDIEKMKANANTWQPTCMFRNANVKSIEFLNWPSSFDDVRQMFNGAHIEEAFPDFDMSGVRCATSMFDEASAGKPMANVPELGSLAIGPYMFRSSSGVLTAAGFKTSEFGFSDKLYDATEMFANINGSKITVDVLPQGIVKVESMFFNSSVVSVGAISLPNAEDCSNMFYKCADLAAVGVFSTAGKSSYTFAYCTELERVTYLDLPTFVDMDSMFYGCKKLTNIAWYNLNKGSSSSNMFKDCPLAGLFGTSMEKYKNSKYVQKIPEKIKGMAYAKAAE